MIEFTEIVDRTLLNQNKTEYQYKQLLFTSALVDLHRHFEDVCNMITRKKHNAFLYDMVSFFTVIYNFIYHYNSDFCLFTLYSSHYCETI